MESVFITRNLGIVFVGYEPIITPEINNLDYTVEKINEYKLDTSKSILKDIKFFQRIALLRVESGSVIVIRKFGESNENWNYDS